MQQNCTKANNPEIAILENKYKSPVIGELPAGKISEVSKLLLLKIHVITGWVIPADNLLPIFVDQFQKKLTEDYRDMNPDEIEFAFRSIGVGVKDWGNQMNLTLIDSVLSDYIVSRLKLSREEERYIKPELTPTQRLWNAFYKQQVINKLPTTIKRFLRWQARTK